MLRPRGGVRRLVSTAPCESIKDQHVEASPQFGVAQAGVRRTRRPVGSEESQMVTKEVRSRMMASIRGRNTTPELQVRKMIHRLGFRFRLHSKDLPGKPDVVLPKHNLAIFIHGCFWHKHEHCRFAVMPKTNSAFWSKKLNGNVVRDRAAIEQLHILGWRTLIIWECTLKSKGQLDKLPKRLARFIPSKQGRAQIPRKPRERLTCAPRLHS